MRVLAIGECMAELAPTEMPGTYRMGFAGDTFNTAWYLARSAPSVAVSYLTAVGDDPLSADMTAFMRRHRIDDQFVLTVPDRTIGLYLISLNDGERQFSYWRGQSAARSLADDPQHLQTAMATAELIYFSGITLAILDPTGRDALLRTMATARAAGKVIVFDPNLRPKLWHSQHAMTQTIMQGAAVSDLVLPSFDDEARWFGDATPSDTVQRYRRAGAETVIVKNGAGPVVFEDSARTGDHPVSAVGHPVDTTAAGDSFNAGVLTGLCNGWPLEQGIAHGCALSRQVIQHKGALVEVTLPDPAP